MSSVRGWCEGRLNVGGRDSVKHDPPHWDRRLEDLQQVPRDGLAFAVGIGGEIQFTGALQRLAQGCLIVFDLARRM